MGCYMLFFFVVNFLFFSTKRGGAERANSLYIFVKERIAFMQMMYEVLTAERGELVHIEHHKGKTDMHKKKLEQKHLNLCLILCIG